MRLWHGCPAQTRHTGSRFIHEDKFNDDLLTFVKGLTRHREARGPLDHPRRAIDTMVQLPIFVKQPTSGWLEPTLRGAPPLAPNREFLR